MSRTLTLSALSLTLFVAGLVACGGPEDASLETPADEQADEALTRFMPIPPNLRFSALRVVDRRVDLVSLAGFGGSSAWTTWTLEADVVNDGGTILDPSIGPTHCGDRVRLSFHHLESAPGFPSVTSASTICLDGLRASGARVTRRFTVTFPDYARARNGIGDHLTTVVGVDRCFDYPSTEVDPARCWLGESNESDNYRFVRLDFGPGL